MIDRERTLAAIRWAEQGPHAGEPSIAPGQAPGGVVFQSWQAGQLVRQHAIAGTAETEAISLAAASELGEAAAEADYAAIESTGQPIEIRCYDGDTGAWVMTRAIGVRGSVSKAS